MIRKAGAELAVPHSGDRWRRIRPGRSGRSMKTRHLTERLLPRGHFVTLSLSYDARTVYFAFADPSGKDPYHAFRLRTGTGVDPGAPDQHVSLVCDGCHGKHLRQLTEGPYDDFDPCPLPDGSIAFESTRRGSKLRCGGGSPELVYTLHRMDGDGANLRTLSFHETHEWHPSVLHDGRIIYTRWDYVDRNAAKFHGLWTCHPDGSNPSVLFGNYTTRPWACFQAKAIPGSSQILFVAGGHHANVGGKLMILDPSQVAFDSKTGEDRTEALRCLTPDVCFAESDGWPKILLLQPLAAVGEVFSGRFQPRAFARRLHGRVSRNRDGAVLLRLLRQPGIALSPPGHLGRLPDPAGTSPRAPCARRFSPCRRIGGRRVAAERRPKKRAAVSFPAADHTLARAPIVSQVANRPRATRVSGIPIRPMHECCWEPFLSSRTARLTSAPRPENHSIFRPSMQRGERFRECVRLSICRVVSGGGASAVTNHPARPPRLGRCWRRRPPSTLEPGPDGTRPFGYPRLIQPLLDRYCVDCHDGSSGMDKSPLVLTGETDGSIQPLLREPPSVPPLAFAG